MSERVKEPLLVTWLLFADNWVHEIILSQGGGRLLAIRKVNRVHYPGSTCIQEAGFDSKNMSTVDWWSGRICNFSQASGGSRKLPQNMPEDTSWFLQAADRLLYSNIISDLYVSTIGLQIPHGFEL